MTLILDRGWSRFPPIAMEGRVENCMALIKVWSTKSYDDTIWSLVVPKHFTISSSVTLVSILEIPDAPVELFWTHRRPGVYLTHQSIASVFQSSITDELRWSILTSEPEWSSCIVDLSYQMKTSPALRQCIQEEWPDCKPSMSSWIMALRRGDRHAIHSISQATYWPKEALLALLQSKSSELLEIIQELDTWNQVNLTSIMCDFTIGKAVMCTKNDSLMLHVLKRTNNSCYEVTLENHQLLIQCRMLKTLSYLHIKKLQLFDVSTFVIAVSEGFYDLMQVLLKKLGVPSYNEVLWYEQLLHIFVTQGRTPLGQQMTRLLLEHIPPHTELSPSLQSQINLMV